MPQSSTKDLRRAKRIELCDVARSGALFSSLFALALALALALARATELMVLRTGYRKAVHKIFAVPRKSNCAMSPETALFLKAES